MTHGSCAHHTADHRNQHDDRMFDGKGHQRHVRESKQHAANRKERRREEEAIDLTDKAQTLGQAGLCRRLRLKAAPTAFGLRPRRTLRRALILRLKFVHRRFPLLSSRKAQPACPFNPGG